MQIYVMVVDLEHNPIAQQLIQKLRELGYSVIASGEVSDWEQAIRDSAIVLDIPDEKGEQNIPEYTVAMESQRRIIVVPVTNPQAYLDKLSDHRIDDASRVRPDVLEWTLDQ